MNKLHSNYTSAGQILVSYLNLPKNWDSNGASEPCCKNIKNALKFLNGCLLQKVSPPTPSLCNKGLVTLTWRCDETNKVISIQDFEDEKYSFIVSSDSSYLSDKDVPMRVTLPNVLLLQIKSIEKELVE